MNAENLVTMLIVFEATCEILFSRNGLEMFGVAAVSHTAQVINIHPMWDCPSESLIDQPVHQESLCI